MNRRAFSRIDLAAVVTIGVCGAVLLGAGRGPRDSARQIKDATQIRNCIQALTIFANGNRDVYPLPSMLDRNNQTVKETGGAKDTTANIFSILVFNSAISPEILISPVENNPNVKIHKAYDNAKPRAAVTPAAALWDPALSADFSPGKTGHISYAHLQPSGARLERWSNTFNAEEAVVCTRGPEITAVKYSEQKRTPLSKFESDPATPTYANDKSNTFGFFKGVQKTPGTFWSGNVAFNDNHVDFIASYLSPGAPVDSGARYQNKEKAWLPDMAFFDEPDDQKSANNFLGIFIKAGDKPADFKPVWD